MNIKTIDPSFSVSPQISPEAVVTAKSAGFKTIINNRPDGEEAVQPTAMEVGDVAMAESLAYVHQPVVSGQITADDVAVFQRLLETSEKPVLAFCRSGTRCTQLWALATATETNVDEIIAKAASAGYDLGPMKSALVSFAAKRG